MHSYLILRLIKLKSGLAESYHDDHAIIPYFAGRVPTMHVCLKIFAESSDFITINITNQVKIQQ